MYWDALDALLNLLFGAVITIASVHDFVKHRSVLGMALGLSLGAAIAGVGLLYLVGFMALEGVSVSRDMVVGIVLIWGAISGIKSPPSPHFPEWTKWAMMILGAGSVLWATVHVLHYYWR